VMVEAFADLHEARRIALLGKISPANELWPQPPDAWGAL
jgi:hypothetical protein